MAEYYAVERSPEYLMHYGVKGMRWGVRKAARLMTLDDKSKKKGQQKLAKHYKKAQKKLEKLNEKADINKQKKNELAYENKSKSSRKIGRVGLGIAAAGLGAGFGYMPIHSRKYKKLEDMAELAIKQHNVGTISDAGLNARLNGMGGIFDQQANLVKKQERFNRRMEGVALGGAAAALGGYGAYGINKLKAHKARKRQTVEGHRKAVTERNAWQQEMNKAFAGTKYVNGGGNRQGGKKKRRH